jgi:hypothetical protein
MKALLRDYLASLRERGELDAILPDLLSGLGFNVITRPGQGTVQRGVDVAAIGPGEKGKETLWLFCVKPGNVGRPDWDTNEQSIRPSLNEILDAYLPHRVQPRHRNLPVNICLVLGGEFQETMLDIWSGYTREKTKRKIKFHYWNGDKLAGLLLTGILREELLPKPFRSSFQKAVAMVDTPDVSVSHFAHLISQLHVEGQKNAKAALRVAQQINICLWVLYVWARDVGNVDAPYRASEKALLVVWNLMRPQIDKRTAIAKSLVRALNEVIHLHLLILAHYIQEKIQPHVAVQHGLTMAVGSREAIDISLALFEVLGRISLLGIWQSWLAERQPELAAKFHTQAHLCVQMGFQLISNNPMLQLPAMDRQAVDVTLFLFLIARIRGYDDVLRAWLDDMVSRFAWTVRYRSRYPCATDDYHDLAHHPVDKSDEYFEEMTAASTFIPLLAVWLHGMQMPAHYDLLSKVVKENLGHCTLQLWFPDATSEDYLYVGGKAHGRVFHELTLRHGGERLIAEIAEVCKEQTGFQKLTAIATGFWPIALVAFRQQGLPIPPHFWIQAFASIPDDSSGAPDSAATA